MTYYSVYVNGKRLAFTYDKRQAENIARANNGIIKSADHTKTGTCKEYIIKYKVFTIPYYYEFKCYAESNDQAITQFIKAEPIGIERYYIESINDI